MLKHTVKTNKQYEATLTEVFHYSERKKRKRMGNCWYCGYIVYFI